MRRAGRGVVAWAVAAALAAVPASAQDAPLDLDADRIRTGEFEYVVLVEGGEYGEYRLEVEEDDGRYRMSEELEAPLGDQETEYVFDRGMRPLEVRREGSAPLELEYSGGEVRGRASLPAETGGREEVSVERRLPAEAVDAGTATAVVLAGPLAEGTGYSLPAFSPRAGVGRLRVEVETVETVEVPAGSFETYRVRLSGSAGVSGVLNVTVESPRVLVRQEPGDGPVTIELRER